MLPIVLIFGLISGAILSLMMLLTLPFLDRIGFDYGEVIGYTTMVAAFLLVFFGVRSYREKVGGALTFGRAFTVGILIAFVASACYVATWEVIYYKLAPDFGDKYQAHLMERAKASGASQEEMEAKAKQMREFMELYKNPVMNVAITFLEPLPVALPVALITAAVLRRKSGGSPAVTG